MSTILLQTNSLLKRYGGLTVTDHVSLDIHAGELHAIIGPNGAGKTTLINLLSGELMSNSGSILFSGKDVTTDVIEKRAKSGLLRSYQITSVFEEFTVRENIVLAAMGTKRHGFRFFKPMLGQHDLQQIANEIIVDTGLSELADTVTDTLAYGERRQLELAMALAANPKFLLLDEPMAGMSVQESAAVVALLQRIKGKYGILLVEHDMEAVFSLADRVSVLVYGKLLFSGTADEVRNHPEVKAIYLGEDSA